MSTRALLRGNALLGDPTALFAMRPGADPYPYYERARSHGAFSRSRISMHVTASHDTANAILRDPRFGPLVRRNSRNIRGVLRPPIRTAATRTTIPV